MKVDAEKTSYNAQASRKMHEFLQAKTWEEKVRSIERMRKATRSAREAMRLHEQSENAPQLKA